MIPESEWKWLGSQGHYCCACQFHLTTVIGDVVISTIGDKIRNNVVVEIGSERTYETMVFKNLGILECGCCVDKNWDEIEMQGYDSSKDAQKGHLDLCYKYAEKQ